MSRPQSSGSTPRPASGTASVSPGSAAAWRWARLAFLVALGVALYLSYASYVGSGVAGCGAEGGCSEVLNSRWSKWLGIPVSLPAAGLYLTLLVLTFQVGRPATGPGWAQPARLLTAGAWTVWGAAAWFLGLSLFVLGKFCPYCLTVHLAGSIGAGLTLQALRSVGGASTGRERKPVGAWAMAPWALLPLGLLVAGQFAFVPKTFRVSGVAAAPQGPSTPAAPSPAAVPPTPAAVVPPVASKEPVPATAAVAAPAPQPTSTRFLAVHGGKFRLDVHQLPLLGSATAPQLMISQFDYTCEHCRRSHGPISQVQRAFSNQLAVISLPMPLDSRCNEWVRRAGHHNGCQLAALALGVWRADPTKFREFDDWVMTSPEGLKVPLALARARGLVGEAALDAAIADPWVANTLQLSIALYRENWLAINNSSMPMMTIGTNIISGTVSSAGDLYPLLDRALGLKRGE